MMTMPNKALHRTAICVWVFALEFLVFISQFVAVGELTSEVIRQGIFQDFFARLLTGDFPSSI